MDEEDQLYTAPERFLGWIHSKTTERGLKQMETQSKVAMLRIGQGRWRQQKILGETDFLLVVF